VRIILVRLATDRKDVVMLRSSSSCSIWLVCTCTCRDSAALPVALMVGKQVFASLVLARLVRQNMMLS